MQEMPAIQEMQETQVQSLGLEDPLVEKMAIYSSILAWGNPMSRGAWWMIIFEVTKESVTS